jgi:hypothetical protein
MIARKTRPFPSVIVKRSRLCLINSKREATSIGCVLHQEERGITPIDQPVIPDIRFVHSPPAPDRPIMIPILVHTIPGFPPVALTRCGLLWSAGDPRFSPASSTYHLYT